MRLDHISYACTSNELADVVQRIGSDLGATFVDGGRHPSFGTRNFILPLAGGAYVEVVSALDHPAAAKAPFGRAVQSRADAGGGWLGWAVAVDDLSPIEQRLGRQGSQGHRIRPDGTELRGKQIGILELMEDPQLPFFVQWECTAAEHPSAAGGPVAIGKVELAGDPEVIRAWLGEPTASPLDEVAVEWLDADEAGVLAVWFSTVNGLVRID